MNLLINHIKQQQTIWYIKKIKVKIKKKKKKKEGIKYRL